MLFVFIYGFTKFISERSYLKKTIQRTPSESHINFPCFPPPWHSWFLFESFGGVLRNPPGGFREAHLLGKPPRATSRTRSASAGPAQVLQRWPQIAGFL